MEIVTNDILQQKETTSKKMRKIADTTRKASCRAIFILLRCLSHGLPDLLPPASSVSCCCLPVVYLQQIYSMPPIYHQAFPQAFFVKNILPLHLVGCENHPSLLCGKSNLPSSGIKMFIKCHVIIKFVDFLIVSNSPYPFGLHRSKYFPEDFPFKSRPY